MSSPVDTEDWKLSAYMEWKPARSRVKCGCDGGMVGGHFKDMEGPRTCPECYGSGTKSFTPKTPKPEIPEALIEHMRRAWMDFWEVKDLFAKESENEQSST